ncbi:corepressor interacting with RBPJ 1 isoform X1 [Brachypodium distachyon]|uniref:Uncharacterized protein n=1 Tax=Brachypodium distachyon TaxID=15368 RepID=I1IZ94_BRADI|nr:corepressor interacting with RBPJ 1 isoform X1 [Brachypodium distachyon]KQJ83372.1 hypothetical protein BRADI_5g14560v3 [Brachypodium distachyon]|eukprot:XP_003580064.1 corepressor interacting with RBPJ 1 isoform X1 [Brachypodium distachyon]
MGKNQAYKAMQRARLGSSSGAPGEGEEDGMTDGSFHSPEWHAARLASLNKTHTLTWEEFKKKQKDEELKRGEVEADKDKMMREYRAQLDAERAQKLGRGRDNVKSKSSSSKKEKKDKDAKKRIKKRRKHRSSSESSSSSSESSSSDDEDRTSRKSRSRSRSKRNKKDKKHRSRSKHAGSDSEEEGGPVRLSKFFGNAKN